MKLTFKTIITLLIVCIILETNLVNFLYQPNSLKSFYAYDLLAASSFALLIIPFLMFVIDPVNAFFHNKSIKQPIHLSIGKNVISSRHLGHANSDFLNLTYIKFSNDSWTIASKKEFFDAANKAISDAWRNRRWYSSCSIVISSQVDLSPIEAEIAVNEVKKLHTDAVVFCLDCKNDMDIFTALPKKIKYF